MPFPESQDANLRVELGFSLISLLNFLVFSFFFNDICPVYVGGISKQSPGGERRERLRAFQEKPIVAKPDMTLPLGGGSRSWKVVGPADKCFARMSFPAVPEPWLIIQTGIPFWPQCCLCKNLGGTPASSISNMLSLALPPQNVLSPTSTGLGQPHVLGNS